MRKIGLLEALMVAVNGTHLTRPRVLDGEVTFRRALIDLIALVIQQHGLYAEEG